MSNILTGFNMQGNDPIDNRIVSPSKFETLEEYLQRVPIQKRYYGLSFYALDENNELRHYTFQTSLIEPTIDDDEEEIERLDKELQEHVKNKEIHKTSEEIRSEIVDADIPDTIARVQWTLDKIEEAVNTVMGDIVDGASDEYNTLKKIQDKIVELRTEMESQLYGDDGGEILKTLEQALKFLNQYKDFIVDIPDNYVNKQDIVDNLNTDDPTKVLSARQGKVLSETLTNYFDSAMASIRAETNRATNAENRIEAKLDSEIDRSTAEDIRIQSELDAEEARAQSEEQRIEDKLDAEIERSTTKDTELGNQIIAETNRAKGEEQRIETKLNNEITRSTAKDADHDSRIEALEGETHVQNTDIGTTSQTFQLQMGKPGNKIKNEDAAISVRNADDSDYVNFIAKNATFKGDLIVEGQSFVTEAETVEIKDNILLLNKGEAGSGVTKGMAGLQIDRGTEPDFQILFVESDRRFKAGEEGNLQCLALRDDDGNMLDGMFTTWDSATHRLKTTNIIPSTRKLFFNTTTNSLGFANHTYDSSYSAKSFTFTTSSGNLFFSAGTTNLNLDTDKTYFRFYKNLFIPSSIVSSGTSISLLNNSGATIATFGSPSTINSSLNVANQVIIKGGSDTKLIMQSADADNHNLIGSQNSSGTVLSKLGYYGTFWGIDNKKIATEEFANNKFLPLAGGTMTGNIMLPDAGSGLNNGHIGTTSGESLVSWNGSNAFISTNNHSTIIRSNASNLIHKRNGINYTIYDSYNFNPGNYLPLTGGNLSGNLLLNNNINLQWKNPSGTATTQMYYNSNSVLVVGNTEDVSLHLRTSAVDLIHDKGGTTYRIWDASNLSTPLLYSGGTAATPTTAVGRNLGVNGSQWTFLSTINAATTSIYAPTTTGTSGQVLTSTGGVPTWSNVSSVGDSRYVLKAGDTMTGDLAFTSSGVIKKTGSYARVIDNVLTSYVSTSFNITGTLKITMPFGWNSTMMTVEISIFSYNRHSNSKYIVSGYNYNSTSSEWYNEGASVFGTYKGAVRLAYDGSKCCILIGTTDSIWHYPRVTIDKVTIHYYGYTATWEKGWEISFITDESNITSIKTITTNGTGLYSQGYLVANQNWINTNFLPLTGGTLSGNLTINTVGSTTFVINNNDTNGSETFMRVLRKGTASAAIGFMDSLGAYIYNYNSKKYLFIDNDGYARVGTTSGSTRLALITDIPSISGYLPLTGGTMTGALTMSNRKNNIVVDVVGGAGHSWDEGAGALSIQVPNDSGQTPLILARRSGAAINTTVATERLLSMELLDTGHSFIIGMSGSEALQLDWTSGKAGTGKLFGKQIVTTDQIPSLSGYATQSWVTSQGYLTSSSLSGYATQTWVNNKNYAVRQSDNVLISHSNEFNFTASSNTSIAINYRGGSGSYTSAAITEYRFYNGQGSYSNVNILANSFTGSLIGNASSATKLGSSTVGGTAKPIYLSSGTATACSATVGSSTVPVYMSSGTITKCSTTLGVSITGNAATATTASNSNNLGGYAAATYVKSTSTTKVSDIQVVTTAGTTTGVLYIVLES